MAAASANAGKLDVDALVGLLQRSFWPVRTLFARLRADEKIVSLCIFFNCKSDKKITILVSIKL